MLPLDLIVILRPVLDHFVEASSHLILVYFGHDVLVGSVDRVGVNLV